MDVDTRGTRRGHIHDLRGVGVMEFPAGEHWCGEMRRAVVSHGLF